MRFKAHALPPPPRSTRTRGAAAAATPPTPQKTRQPQNRKEPEPRPSLVMRPTPSVVVEDRTRHTTYTRDLGNGLTLGGSWAAKEAAVRTAPQSLHTGLYLNFSAAAATNTAAPPPRSYLARP